MRTRSVLLVVALAACNPPIETNVDPTIVISSPEDNGTTVLEGEPFEVVYRAFDRDEDDVLTVVISSSIDGELEVIEGAANGEDASASLTLSGGDHTITLSVTDGNGGQSNDTVEVAVRGAPTAFEVAISPDAPDTNDDLEAEITTSSMDPDGGDITYTYVWSKEGSSQVFSDPTLSADETERDEVWTITVTAEDEDGLTTDASETVTIGNAPPDEGATVTVFPSSPLPINDLACSAEGGSDPDDDDISYTYSWVIGGSEVGTDSVLDAALTTAGDEVTCVVTVSDGTDDGPEAETSVTILDETIAVDEAGIAIDGEDAGDGFGEAAAALSLDAVDGDDLAVGLPGDSTYASKAGMVAIFRGGALSDGLTPDERTGTIKGTTGEMLGATVQAIPDADGDGIEDLLIGGLGDGVSTRPIVYLIAGDAIENALPVEAGELTDTSFTVGNINSIWGSAVDGGDFDGNGEAEIAVSFSDTGSSGIGRVYLFASDDLGAALSVTDGTDFYGVTADDGFGEALAMQGDVDGDGLNDLLIGAPDSGAGTNAWLFLGETTLAATSASAADWSQRTTADEGSGAEVLLVPDLDDDGYDEVAVAATAYAVTGKDVGAVALFRGDASFSGTATPGSADVLLRGVEDGGGFGSSVQAIPDLGSDGIPEVAVAAPAEDGGAGRVYVFAGADLAVDGTYDGDDDAALVLEGESSTAGITLPGPGGDLDDDGFYDLLITSPTLNSSTGRIYVFLTGE